MIDARHLRRRPPCIVTQEARDGQIVVARVADDVTGQTLEAPQWLRRTAIAEMPISETHHR